MDTLAARLADRIEQRAKAAPDTPYEMRGVVGFPVSSDPEISKLAKQQADAVQAAKDDADAANSNEKDSSNEDKSK